MKNLKQYGIFAIIVLAALIAAKTPDQAINYEFRQMTVVESVIPGGFGRSRLLMTDAGGKLEEVKMKNFFSLVGINFKNINENDATITTHINQMTVDGWELVNVNSGVYASSETNVNSGEGSSNSSNQGLFISRYLFKRPL